MAFRKYCSLINHYQIKQIDFWLRSYPELNDAIYVAHEKIHGSNFGIHVTDANITFQKRNSRLSPDSNFFDHKRVMDKYKELTSSLQKYVIDNKHKSIIVYGELFGKGIQKGVYYGEDKYFRIFDLVIDGMILSPKEVQIVLSLIGHAHLIAPVIPILFNGLSEAMAFNTNFNTMLSDKDNNMCEGVVIKPYNKVYLNNDGSPFYIKKKNPDFLESGAVRETKVISDVCYLLYEKFPSYLNDNRVDTLFSKEGAIKNEKEIGKYIVMLLEDAKKDFIEDYKETIEGLQEEEFKFIIKKNGSIAANLIKNRLNKA